MILIKRLVQGSTDGNSSSQPVSSPDRVVEPWLEMFRRNFKSSNYRLGRIIDFCGFSNRFFLGQWFDQSERELVTLKTSLLIISQSYLYQQQNEIGLLLPFNDSAWVIVTMTQNIWLIIYDASILEPWPMRIARSGSYCCCRRRRFFKICFRLNRDKGTLKVLQISDWFKITYSDLLKNLTWISVVYQRKINCTMNFSGLHTRFQKLTLDDHA